MNKHESNADLMTALQTPAGQLPLDRAARESSALDPAMGELAARTAAAFRAETRIIYHCPAVVTVAQAAHALTAGLLYDGTLYPAARPHAPTGISLRAVPVTLPAIPPGRLGAPGVAERVVTGIEASGSAAAMADIDVWYSWGNPLMQDLHCRVPWTLPAPDDAAADLGRLLALLAESPVLMGHGGDPALALRAMAARCGYSDDELDRIRRALADRDLTLTADDRGLVAQAVRQ